MFIDADEDVLGVQIFCLNLEKKLLAEDCEKKEWKIGETTVIAFIANGECRSAFAERGSQYLFCNSLDMISEMTIRWINVTNDGLMNDPDFVSSVKGTDIERKVGVHLFLRGEYYYPKDMMTKSWLFLNIPYWLYPIIEAHCKSMLIAISFPPEQSEIEAEFQVDFRHNKGLEIFKHVAHASFSKTDPFVPFDAISYAVVSADFWRIRAEDMKVFLNEEPVGKRRMEELANAKGMSVDDYLASSENEMELQPEDTLHDSIPFKMVNKHLMARSTGNCFAVHYVDIGRFIESQIPKFKKTSIGVWIKLNGGDLLDELIPQIIERIGPIGGLVKKSTQGFQIEYVLLRK